MYKRIFSLVLAICCVLTLLPVAAPKASAAQMPIQEINIPTTVNPLYDDVLDVEDFIDELKTLKRPAHTGGMTTMSSEDEYVDMYTAMEEVREGLKARESSITVYYYVPYSSDMGDSQAYVGEASTVILAAAMEHTGNPTEGDYLLWQWGTYDIDGLYGVDEEYGVIYAEITYTMTYYTTAAQEAEMDRAVDNLLAKLDLEEATDYAKVKRVYDYICANVTYDYDNLYDDSYLLKYTGYAALVDGTAVCQGYAVLFYRLMLELGIDSRVIVGWQTSSGGAHAWNIVELYDDYYNLDATWDAGYTDYYFFLTNEANFVDHTRDDAYNSAEFHAAYPMSETDFVPVSLEITVQPANQTVKPGATATFTVEAEGNGLTYQWEYRENVNKTWKALTGSTGTTLEILGKAYRNGYQYRCVVTDATGVVLYTDVATLTIKEEIADAEITVQPANQTVKPGATATFTVEAEGNGLTYQWEYRENANKTWKALTGSTGTTLEILGKAYRNGYQYRCVVTDANGAVLYTDVATLTIKEEVADAEITVQPVNQTVKPGATATFTVEAEGDGLTYQWEYRENANKTWKALTGSTGTTLEIVGKAYRNGYQYRCVVTDANGNTVASDNAILTVE